MSCVYVIQSSLDVSKMKVGYSQDNTPAARIRAIQTSVPGKIIELRRFVGFKRADERRIHLMLKAYAVPDGGKEWFYCNATTLGILQLVADEPSEDAEASRYYPAEAVSAVILHNCFLRCGRCHELVPVQLRQTEDAAIRNQPRCGPCRNLGVGS